MVLSNSKHSKKSNEYPKKKTNIARGYSTKIHTSGICTSEDRTSGGCGGTLVNYIFEKVTVLIISRSLKVIGHFRYMKQNYLRHGNWKFKYWQYVPFFNVLYDSPSWAQERKSATKPMDWVNFAKTGVRGELFSVSQLLYHYTRNFQNVSKNYGAFLPSKI